MTYEPFEESIVLTRAQYEAKRAQIAWLEDERVRLCGVLNMLVEATEHENFNRAYGRAMSTNLRAAIKRAKEVLDGT